jgi:preprotein translocase subunit SecA
VQVEQVDDADAEGAHAEHEHHPVILAKGLDAPARPAGLQYSAPTVDGEGGVELRSESSSVATDVEYAGTPKNAPCPCGSGKKYKRCHGAEEQ